MNEDRWFTSTDPAAMLDFLQARGRGSERKLWLFTAACVRSFRTVFGDQMESVSLAIAFERYADGQSSHADLFRCIITDEAFDRHFPDGVIPPSRYLEPVKTAKWAAKTALDFSHPDRRDITVEEKAVICNLLRDIVGNPFHSANCDPTWLKPTVLALAQAAYGDRLPDGFLDPVLLAAVADALEEAGCGDPTMLEHLRGKGAHVRACHVLDLLLNKT